MPNPRFEVGDKVRVVRIMASPGPGENNDDLSEGGQLKLEAFIGQVFKIKMIDRDHNDGVLIHYEMDNCDDSFYEGELTYA
jgi:hypothetical protein